MMRCIAYVFLVALCSLNTSTGISREATKDLLEVAHFYENCPQISMDITVMAYGSETDNQGMLLGKAIMKKQGKNYYSKFLQEEMITNRENTLIIDHEEKSFLFFDHPSPVSEQQLTAFKLDSLLATGDSLTYEGMKSKHRHYRMLPATGSIRQVEIFLDAKKPLIKRIVYTYRESTDEFDHGMYRVSIDYHTVKTGSPDPGYFSISKYIRLSENGAVPREAWKDYNLRTITNHTQ